MFVRDGKWSDQRSGCGAKFYPMAKSGMRRERVEEKGEEAPSLVPTELKTMIAIVFLWSTESLGRAYENKMRVAPCTRGGAVRRHNNAIDDLRRQQER